jgi:ribosomal protein L12E/L44/L45/RPP1/RPP2
VAALTGIALANASNRDDDERERKEEEERKIREEEEQKQKEEETKKCKKRLMINLFKLIIKVPIS